MSVPLIHESEVEELDMPGRRMRWVISDQGVPAKYCSACVIKVAPGEKVQPAHSHPQGEEVIYIVSGTGRVLVAGEVGPVRAGTTVLFPKGHIHMLHNSGDEEMKVLCFFSPGTSLDNYEMHPEVDFPD